MSPSIASLKVDITGKVIDGKRGVWSKVITVGEPKISVLHPRGIVAVPSQRDSIDQAGCCGLA